MAEAADGAGILARARQGDEEAFRVLVEQHSRSVFRLAHRMMGNEQDAEDVVQESFLRAYRQLGRFEARANFGTWIYRIAANCCVDLMRSREVRRARFTNESFDAAGQEASTGEPGPERLAESAEIERRVQAALGTLSPLERAAFTLRHCEGRSIDELCAILGLRGSAAKHSVFRAVRKLRAVLAPLRHRPS